MQFDSDREIASENEAETNSDCATASEQSDKIDSDTTEQLTDLLTPLATGMRLPDPARPMLSGARRWLDQIFWGNCHPFLNTK